MLQLALQKDDSTSNGTDKMAEETNISPVHVALRTSVITTDDDGIFILPPSETKEVTATTATATAAIDNSGSTPTDHVAKTAAIELGTRTIQPPSNPSPPSITIIDKDKSGAATSHLSMEMSSVTLQKHQNDSDILIDMPPSPSAWRSSELSANSHLPSSMSTAAFSAQHHILLPYVKPPPTTVHEDESKNITSVNNEWPLCTVAMQQAAPTSIPNYPLPPPQRSGSPIFSPSLLPPFNHGRNSGADSSKNEPQYKGSSSTSIPILSSTSSFASIPPSVQSASSSSGILASLPTVHPAVPLSLLHSRNRSGCSQSLTRSLLPMTHTSHLHSDIPTTTDLPLPSTSPLSVVPFSLHKLRSKLTLTDTQWRTPRVRRATIDSPTPLQGIVIESLKTPQAIENLSACQTPSLSQLQPQLPPSQNQQSRFEWPLDHPSSLAEISTTEAPGEETVKRVREFGPNYVTAIANFSSSELPGSALPSSTPRTSKGYSSNTDGSTTSPRGADVGISEGLPPITTHTGPLPRQRALSTGSIPSPIIGSNDLEQWSQAFVPLEIRFTPTLGAPPPGTHAPPSPPLLPLTTAPCGGEKDGSIGPDGIVNGQKAPLPPLLSSPTSCQVSIDVEGHDEKTTYTGDTRHQDAAELTDSDMFTDTDLDPDDHNNGRLGVQLRRATNHLRRSRLKRSSLGSGTGSRSRTGVASHPRSAYSASLSSSSSAVVAPTIPPTQPHPDASENLLAPSSILVEVSPSHAAADVQASQADDNRLLHNSSTAIHHHRPSSPLSTFGSRLLSNFSSAWNFHPSQPYNHRPTPRLRGAGARAVGRGAGVTPDGDLEDHQLSDRQGSMVRSSPTLFFGTAHHAGDNVRQLPLLWRFPSHDDGDHRPNANNHPGGMTRWRPRFPKSYSVATPPSSSGGGGGGRGGYGDGSGDGNGSVAGGQGGGLGVKHHSRQFLKQFDEKARFSNERTYLHWIKFGMLLGSMALTLLSFGDRKSVGFPVGMFLVLVAMATLAYATTMFHCRDYWMRHRRTDRLYYDRVGPSILFAALFLAYATNVILTVYRITEMQDDNQHTFLGNPNGPLDV